MKSFSLRLYAVTDNAWLCGRSLANDVELALMGGATMIQLRQKGAGADELCRAAKELKPVCKKYGAPLIVNDSVQAARESGADGVHLGQGDMNAADARKILGGDRIIGVSASTVTRALRAQQDGADYLGVGAVFHTGTKGDATPVSFDTLKSICEAVTIPVVAIGGITRDNILSLAGSGIAGAAVVSAIFAKDDIRAAAAELLGLARRL